MKIKVKAKVSSLVSINEIYLTQGIEYEIEESSFSDEIFERIGQ